VDHKKGSRPDYDYQDIEAGGYIAGILGFVAALAVILKLVGVGAGGSHLEEVEDIKDTEEQLPQV
jgi:hypothetical protein